METKLDKEWIALARLNVSEVKDYSKLLEVFLYSDIISRKLVEKITIYGTMINETVPHLKMYFAESIPYLRKARTTLNLLIQRQKDIDLVYPKLTKIFQANFDNINQFFKTFNLQVEELNELSSSDETQRSLVQRVINPNYDKSKQTTALVNKIVKTISDPRIETCSEMADIASQLKDDYEGHSFKENQETVETSELFLQSISHLYNRDKDLKLARERATELSQFSDLEMTPRQRKIKKLIEQSSKNILSNGGS